MKIYEIYIMPEKGFWRVGEKGMPSKLPSGIEGAGVGTGVSLDEFVKKMVGTIRKAVQPEDKVVYKMGLPPWWPHPTLEATEEEVMELIGKYEDSKPKEIEPRYPFDHYCD